VTKQVIDDKFAGGVLTFDIKNGGIGYSDKAGNLTDDLKAAADKYSTAIADGVFTVPQTEAEFSAFVAPAL
jgi:basic membrane protein A